MRAGEIGAAARAGGPTAHAKQGASKTLPSAARRSKPACHRLIMTLAYALPAARAALPRLGARAPLRPARSRRVAVRAAADQPFELQNYQEAVVAE